MDLQDYIKALLRNQGSMGSNLKPFVMKHKGVTAVEFEKAVQILLQKGEVSFSERGWLTLIE